MICQSCSHYVEPELIFEDSSSKTTTSNSTSTSSPVVTLASLRAVAAPPPATVRVCAPCAVSTHKVVVAGDVPVEISKVEEAINKTPAYVYALYHKTEELYIGSLSVVCVQARGLPAADVNGLADPYVNLTLTGYTLSGGQEWPEGWRVAYHTSTRYATLNPIWGGAEHFFYKVPRSEGVLRVEVRDWDIGISDDLLSVVEIPLAGLLHQRRVDVWVPLVSAEDGESGGEIRLMMHYKYNRAGEALSKFWPEPPPVKEVVQFSPNRVYKHVVDLMEETKPYLAMLAQVGSVLKWEKPVVTLGVFAILVALTLYPRYAFSCVQFSLVLYVGFMFVCRKGRQHARDVEEAKKKNLNLRDFLAQRRQQGKGVVGRLASLRSGVRRRRSSSGGGGGGKEKEKEEGGGVDASNSSSSSSSSSSGGGEALAEEQKKQQEEEQQGIASSGLVINFLGKRIGRSEATTNLQNALGMLVLLLQSIRKLLEWESPAITVVFVLILLGSATMHLFVSVTWLFLLGELMVFQLLSWPLQMAGWWGVIIGKVASSLLTQAKFVLMRKGKVPGEVVLGKEEKEEGEEEGKEEKGGKVKSG